MGSGELPELLDVNTDHEPKVIILNASAFVDYYCELLGKKIFDIFAPLLRDSYEAHLAVTPPQAPSWELAVWMHEEHRPKLAQLQQETLEEIVALLRRLYHRLPERTRLAYAKSIAWHLQLRTRILFDPLPHLVKALVGDVAQPEEWRTSNPPDGGSSPPVPAAR
jgi:hypothetical protein